MERRLEPEVMDTREEADAYASMDHTAANESFVQRLFALGARGRMLDIGTGPGHIPLLICERDSEARVLGVDLAHHMLDHARRLLSRSAWAGRVEYAIGDAKALALPSQAFDTVCSNTILHHIPDPTPFLREARRVLRPGGALLIRDLYRPKRPEDAEALVRRHAAGASPAQQALFRDSLCAALTPGELRAVADEAGLGDAALHIDSDRHVSLQLAAH